jgi:hypothetical protein
MTDRPDTAREALAAWLAEEAALYETAAGQLDGIPFETVAHVFRVIEARIRRGGADAALTASGYAIVPAAEGEVGEQIAWARKASSAIYAAVDATVADDISPKLVSLASHLERLAAENERLAEHKRKQAEDIMALGQLVYADENTTWRARAERAEAENERLKAGLRQIAKETETDHIGDKWLTRAATIARAALTQEPS